ncbi:MAG: DinB family protein, partial [Acidobacteriota bacterium]|nr:DinB family protein [Acidobacteriota bacterium]
TWANERLLDFCAGLDDATLDATGGGTYGSVRDTLVHLFGAQGRYVHLLTGQAPQTMVSEREPWPGFETLRASARVSGSALEAVAARADSMDILRGERGGQPYELPVGVVMTQAINHATEHRAHINTILTQAGIEPPELDSWNWFEQGLV